jgi:predicted DNA-binding transcriptional regulator AlpA
MTKEKRLNIPEVAKLTGVCQQRVKAKYKQGHYPHAETCECGRTLLIPVADVTEDLQQRGHKRPKGKV